MSSRLSVCLLLAAVTSLLAGCGDSGGSTVASVSPSSSAETSAASADPASLLAQLDGSSDVATYSSALDAWQAECKQDRETDAGYVDAAFNDEQKNGGAEGSRLIVMRHLTASVPAGMGPTDCASVTAAYLTLVEQ